MLATINKVDKTTRESTSTEDLESNMNDMTKVRDNIKSANTTTAANNTSKEIHNDKHETETLTPSPRGKSLGSIKSNIANLESEFVEFKQSVLKSFLATTDCMAKKDKEIKTLTDKINMTQSNATNLRKLINELNIKTTTKDK